MTGNNAVQYADNHSPSLDHTTGQPPTVGRQAPPPLVDDGRSYVTVGIGGEVFALDVAQVREILDIVPMSRVPNTPAFVRGMIDVRGAGVPVIDMRMRLGLPVSEDTLNSRIVVLEISLSGRSLVIGALTDQVYEVTPLDDGALEPPPEFGVRWRSDFIRGIGRKDERFVMILDLDILFESDPLDSMAVDADSRPEILDS